MTQELRDRIPKACDIGQDRCLVLQLDLYEMHGEREEYCTPICTICSARVHSFCNRAIFPTPDSQEVFSQPTSLHTPISKKTKQHQNLCAACYDTLMILERLMDDDLIVDFARRKYHDYEEERVVITQPLWDALMERMSESFHYVQTGIDVPIYQASICHLYHNKSIPAFKKLIVDGTSATPPIIKQQDMRHTQSVDMTELTQRSDQTATFTPHTPAASTSLLLVV